MYDRTIDRMSDSASEFLVQFYLQSPKLSVSVLLAAWLVLFFAALWYFVLLPATSNNLVNGSFEARLVGCRMVTSLATRAVSRRFSSPFAKDTSNR